MLSLSPTRLVQYSGDENGYSVSTLVLLYVICTCAIRTLRLQY